MNFFKTTFFLLVCFFCNVFFAKAINADKLQNYKQQQQCAFDNLFINPKKAYLIADSLLNFYDVPDSIYAANFNIKAIYFALENENDSALHFIDKAIDKSIFDFKTNLGFLLNKAIILKNNNKIQSALSQLYKIEIDAKRLGFNEVLGKAYGELASNFFNNGLFEEAIDYIIKSIELFESEKEVNPNNIYIEKQKLANYYLSLKNYEKAIVIYEEILPYFEVNELFDKYCLSLIGYIESLIKINELDSALYYAKKLDEGVIRFNNSDWQALSKEKLAKIYFNMNSLEQALSYFKEATQLSHNANSKYFLSIYSDFLNYLNTNQLFAETSLLIKQYENKFEITKYQKTDRKNYYRALTNYYRFKKDWTKVFVYRDSVDILRSNIESKYNLFNIMRIEAEYKTKILEQNNQLLSEKLEQEKKKNLYFIFLLVSLVLIFIVSFRNYLLSRKLLKANLEKTIQTKTALEKQLKAEKEFNFLKEKTIQNQKMEILQTAIEKTELNKKIDDLIDNIYTSNKLKISQKLKVIKSPQSNVLFIVERYKNLNPNFEDNLKRISDQISKSDIEFSILIIVGLSYKEIASLLQISIESVYKKKYRLAKKLNIYADMQIIDFLKNI